MTSRRHSLVLGTAFGLVAGIILGAGTVLAQDPNAPTPSATPGASDSGATIIHGLPDPATTGVGVASAGAAIAYPFFGSSSGVAPDHTIVVTGTGQADMKTDGSNRAAAQKTALEAALADAKAQAGVIANATGVSISGVLSVSASVSGFGPIPYAVGVSGSASGQTVPAPVPTEPVAQTLSVSVTVAYRIG
jgi:uncharacterized protein YggE